MNDFRTSKKTELTEDDIQFIMANTDFDRDKIITWFNQFKQQCPDCKLTKPEFVQFYKNLIPGDHPDEDKYCENVFAAFDSDNNGTIDFAEFLLSFWVRAKGSQKDKLNWLFDIYDADKSNYITSWELSRVLKFLLSIKNSKEDPYILSRKIFQTMDRSKDGKLTRQEFIAGFTKEENLRNLLAPF